MIVRAMILGATLAAALISVTHTAGAADPDTVCQSSKLKTAGKYASCLLSADSKATKTSTSPDYAKCDLAYSMKWSGAEDKAGTGVCPSEGDEAEIQDFIVACDQAVADALAGGALLTDVVTCNASLGACGPALTTCNTNLATTAADLATCLAEPSAPPATTRQTTCYLYPTDNLISCAGTGQDGEYQYGATRNFVDNGDGTITDTSTGLMWEVLTNDGSIHDKDTNYTWGAAFSTKIANLNTNSYAGYNDWRLPNRFELDTLVVLDVTGPATHDAFKSPTCNVGCTATTCSCTANDWYWSSTTYVGNPLYKWAVNFNTGDVEALGQGGSPSHVRAVRGGY